MFIVYRVVLYLYKYFNFFQFSVKFPRSRFSDSSSSSDSRKVSDSRQSSTEEVAQELFHNIEQVSHLSNSQGS